LISYLTIKNVSPLVIQYHSLELTAEIQRKQSVLQAKSDSESYIQAFEKFTI